MRLPRGQKYLHPMLGLLSKSRWEAFFVRRAAWRRQDTLNSSRHRCWRDSTVAWLANKLAEFDLALRPGDIVLSGSIIRMLEVKAGQSVRVTFSRIGSVGAHFV